MYIDQNPVPKNIQSVVLKEEQYHHCKIVWLRYQASFFGKFEAAEIYDERDNFIFTMNRDDDDSTNNEYHCKVKEYIDHNFE